MNIILISESTVGYHSDTKEDNVKIIPYVFIPTIKEINQEIKINASCNNDEIKKAIEYYASNKDTVFFLGYDLDENGEYMAQAFRNFLLDKKVKKEDIYRTPLTEKGYVAVTDFLDISDYIKFRYLQEKFIKELRKEENLRISVLNFLSLKYLVEKKGQKINFDKLEGKFNLEETSTITFIVNNLLKEM